jgi:F1F0 ATPase subunit 2
MTAMIDAEVLVLAGAAGLLLGAIFFGGLWWTVRRGVASQRAALWFLGSLVIRTGISLAGFYFVSGGRWDRLLACLLGFTIARFIVTRLGGPPVGSGDSTAKEPGHAP